MLQQLQKYIDEGTYDLAIEYGTNHLEQVEQDYYPFFLLLIEALFANESYDKARDLLQDELTLPYIPQNYIEKINELYAYCLTQLKHSQVVMMDTATLSSYLLSDDPHLVVQALFQLESHNIRMFEEQIVQFFNRDAFEFEKGLLLDLMRQQQINQFFTLNKFGQDLEVNPYSLEPIYATTYLMQCLSSAEDRLLKHPSYREIVCDLIKSYCFQRYPLDMTYETQDLVIAIIMYVFETSGFDAYDEHLKLDEQLYNKIKISIESTISL